MCKSHLLIKTAGRCGSSLAYNYFISQGYSGYEIHQEIEEYGDDNPVLLAALESGANETAVIHDHSVYFLPHDISKFYGLLIKRRNIFQQALSMRVGQHTQIYHFFKDDPKIEELDISKFDKSLTISKDEILDIIRTTISKDRDRADVFLDFEIPFSTIYFEDFVNDPDWFRAYYGRSARNVKCYDWPMEKMKYTAKNIVTNYNDLVKWWEDNSEKYSKEKFYGNYSDPQNLSLKYLTNKMNTLDSKSASIDPAS